MNGKSSNPSGSGMPGQAQRASEPSPAGAARIIEVPDLMQGASEVLLRFEGVIYRLRITSNKKLILTK